MVDEVGVCITEAAAAATDEAGGTASPIVAQAAERAIDGASRLALPTQTTIAADDHEHTPAALSQPRRAHATPKVMMHSRGAPVSKGEPRSRRPTTTHRTLGDMTNQM